MPQNGSTSGLRPGGERGLVGAGADRARLDLRGDVRDLVVAERDVQQHLVRRRVGYGSSVMCAA